MDPDLGDDTPVVDNAGNTLVKIVLAGEDGNSGIVYVLPSDADKILNGELEISYTENNEIVLVPNSQFQELDQQQMEMEMHGAESDGSESNEELSAIKKESLVNASFLTSSSDRNMAFWRPTTLQEDHIVDIKRSCHQLCTKKKLIERYDQRKKQLLDQIKTRKHVFYNSSPQSQQEMLELLNFSPDQCSEGSDRFNLLRKHSMIFRLGSNSKVLTMYEQAVNEAAAQICVLCPALIFHQRELAMHAKQALKEVAFDFSSGTRSSSIGSTIFSNSSNLPSESTSISTAAIGSDLSTAQNDLGDSISHHKDMASHLLNLPRPPVQMISSSSLPEPGDDLNEMDYDAPGSDRGKIDLTQLEKEHVKNSAKIALPDIPDVDLKPREECSLIENFVLADALKLCQMDDEALDQNMDTIYEVATIHGRYNSGPINPSSQLSRYQVVVNEAAAWLVRFQPRLVTHFNILKEWAHRVAEKSGVFSASTTSQMISSATKAEKRSIDYYSYTGNSFEHGSADHLASGVTRNSVVSEESLADRFGIQHPSAIRLVDMDYMDAAHDCLLLMECIEEEVELDKNEILRLSGAKTLMDVTKIDVPCQNYTRINVADLSECINLRQLNLEENALRIFPNRLHLPRLTQLSICGNRFSQTPLVEQFPRLRHLTIDQMFHQRLEPRLLAFFCPHLKTINGELFRNQIAEFITRFIQDNYGNFEPNIRSKWESEFSSRFFESKSRDERICVLEDMVRALNKKNSSGELIDLHMDLLILRFIDENIRKKQSNKDFEILIGGPLSSCKSSQVMDRNYYQQLSDESINQGSGTLEEDEEIENSDKLEECRLEGERALFQAAEETLGLHLPQDFVGYDAAESENAFYSTGPPSPSGGTQISLPQLHIGRSLRQGRSIVMSLVNSKSVQGRPTAEFLPGELRNKDYVKGHVASEIYKKAVKDQLGGGSSMSSIKPGQASLLSTSKKQLFCSNGRGRGRILDKTPLNELSGNPPYSSYENHYQQQIAPGGALMGTSKRRGRPIKTEYPYSINQPNRPGEMMLNADDMAGSDYGLLVGTQANIVPPRPSGKRRQPGTQRSLRDLCTQAEIIDAGGSGATSLVLAIDYDPLHFIRCHARDNDTKDYVTKVWRCAFEPSPHHPETETTHVVATCGGECVCLINCETGKVMKRFKHADEEFTCLAWTTVESETGQKTNLLAAAGLLQDIRLLHPEQLMCYAEMKGHTDDVTAMFFHQTNPTILFSGDSKAAILVWDIGVPQGGGPEYKTRHSLMMRLRCPRLDVNPVLNLVFVPHYDFLVAGCEDGMFAWKLSEFRSEKREKEPDMELRVPCENEINLDGLAQLSENALIMKGIERGSIQVFDFASVLERRKGLQKLVPIEIRGRLDWAHTDEIYISVSVRQSMGAVLCGDDSGNIWIYDLDPYLAELQTNCRNKFEVKPLKILEWPECSMYGAENEAKAGSRYNQGTGVSGFKSPVINAVDMSSDGHYVVAVTDNNLVCIWRYAPQSTSTALNNTSSEYY